MHWLTKPGTSHPEMDRITIQGSRELRSIPGVRNFGAHIGQALIMDEVVGIYFGENWISVDPNVDYDETVAKIQEVVDGYPGLYRDVQTYLKERIREVLTGSGEAIVIRIYGPELEVLRSKADEVRDAIAEIDGIVDLHVELQEDVPQVEVEVDLEAAKYYGIKPGDVRRAAATLISGVEVGDIYEHHGRTYEVYLWSTPETRNSVSDIRELLIDTPAGGHIRLEDVADVRIGPVPNVIAREDMSRRINVEANVRGRDLGSVAQDVARCPRDDRVSSRVPPGADRRIRRAEGGPTAPPDRFGGSPRSAFSSCCKYASAAGAWRRSPSSLCHRRWWVGCSRRFSVSA